MKILVGSKNPVKINSAKEAFENYYKDEIEAVGIAVSSGVPEQPKNEEVFIGARNRAMNLYKINNEKKLGAEYFVGIEGGIEYRFDRWYSFGCMCILDVDANEGFGSSPHFELPQSIIDKLLNGGELGPVMDEIMNTQNSKQRGGAIGYFTKGVMNRTQLYVPGLLTALIPFQHKEMFFVK